MASTVTRSKEEAFITLAVSLKKKTQTIWAQTPNFLIPKKIIAHIPTLDKEN